MIGLQRLDNVRACIESVIDAGIPGELIETGVCVAKHEIEIRSWTARAANGD
jgi:Macrocin-O-methyltransferase (TylF)